MGKLRLSLRRLPATIVSIQLVFPASGKAHPVGSGSDWAKIVICFHSISFPSEWESHGRNANKLLAFSVSIQLVFPASGKATLSAPNSFARLGFHSISFPSEWESFIPSNRVAVYSIADVSIQLVFPASGKVRLVSS